LPARPLCHRRCRRRHLCRRAATAVAAAAAAVCFRDEIIQNQARDMDTVRVVEQTLESQRQQEETRKHDKQAEAQRLRLKRRKMRSEAVEVALGERGGRLLECLGVPRTRLL
jgi:hypothetical protein